MRPNNRGVFTALHFRLLGGGSMVYAPPKRTHAGEGWRRFRCRAAEPSLSTPTRAFKAQQSAGDLP
jgi:hypothetical protein